MKPSGVVFTEGAAKRVADATKWVERHRGESAGMDSSAVGVETVYARVTSGTPDIDGYYSAAITLFSAADAAWTDYSAVKVGAVNGGSLTNGERYAVRPVGRTGAGDELYIAVGSGGAGTLTIEAVDGSPSFTGTSKILVDQDDGISITSSVAGTVRMDLLPASATQTGVINTTTQTIAGAKTVQCSTEGVAALTVTGNITTAYEETAATVLVRNDADLYTDPVQSTLKTELQLEAGNFNTGWMSLITTYASTPYRSWGVGVAALGIVRERGVYGATDLLFPIEATSNGVLVASWHPESGNAVDAEPYYGVARNKLGVFTIEKGLYGTAYDGSTYSGGLLTAFGSGPSTIDGGTW